MQGLRVYRLALEFYWMVLKLRLPPELSGQLRRAATSIINNIKEGSSRRTLPDRLRFYDIAFGSAKESQGGCRRSAFGCRWYNCCANCSAAKGCKALMGTKLKGFSAATWY